MKRSLLLCLTTGLLFSTVHRLPAPISEESPIPQPKSSYRPQKEQKHLSGSITSSVNAIETPLGRYKKTVDDAIGSSWYQHLEGKDNFFNIGTARVVFWVDPSGRVKDLKVIQNSSNVAFAAVCIQSILEIKLPQIPEGLAVVLPPNGLHEEISFTLYRTDSATKTATSPTPSPRVQN